MKSSFPEERIEKLLNKCDQMISQHAYLRDRYGNNALTLDIILILFSASLSALVFAPPDFPAQYISQNFDNQPLIGGISLVVFVASILSWKVDWKSKQSSHAEAAKLLSELKQRLITAIQSEAPIRPDLEESLKADYDLVLQKCTPIPEKDFLRTKQYHKRKITISRHLDENPHATLCLLKLRLLLRDNFHRTRTEEER